jgi:hypothetical protein
MSDVVIDVLKEELENAENFIELINKKYGKLGGASLIKRKRYHQEYYYIQYKKNGKLKSEYIGKLDDKKLKEWNLKIKEAHNQKRKISKIKKRIKFIKASLKHENIVK